MSSKNLTIDKNNKGGSEGVGTGRNTVGGAASTGAQPTGTVQEGQAGKRRTRTQLLTAGSTFHVNQNDVFENASSFRTRHEKRKIEIVVEDPERLESERPDPKRPDLDRPKHEQSELEHRGPLDLEPDDTVLPHEGTTYFTNWPSAPAAETATTSTAGADSSYYLPTERESQFSQKLEALKLRAKLKPRTKSSTTPQPTIGIVPEGQGSQIDPTVDRQKEHPVDTQDIVDSPPKDSGSYVSGTAGELVEETQAHHEERLQPAALAVTTGEGSTHGLPEEVTHGGRAGVPTAAAPPPGTEGKSPPTEGGRSASGSIGPSTGNNSNPDTDDEDRKSMSKMTGVKKEPEPYPKGKRGSKEDGKPRSLSCE